jgi:hypothetical protein
VAEVGNDRNDVADDQHGERCENDDAFLFHGACDAAERQADR